MANCAEFLREYSDYRDGYTAQPRRAELREHALLCESCARYDEVLTAGVGELKSIPPVEPSDEFFARLQHRIFHLEEERVWWARPDTSGTSVAFVALLAVLIGAAAWIPTLGAEPPLVHLAPVVAIAPAQNQELPTLFREGPLLTAPRPLPQTYARASNSVFFRYTRLGTRPAVQSVAVYPR